MKVENTSTSTLNYRTQLTRTTSEAVAVHRIELLRNLRFRGEGLHAFNDNNAVLAAFSFSGRQWVWSVKTSQ